MEKPQTTKSDNWVKINSLLLGLIATFVIMNYLENHYKETHPAPKKSQKMSTPQKTVKKRRVQAVEPTDTEASFIDPRCNSLTPYWGGRWGCVVRPI